MLKEWFWGCYASCYDTLVHLSPYQQMLADLVDAMDLQPGMRILNAGCGTGNLERYLLKQGIDCHITSVDFSPEMIRRSQRKCRGGEIDFHVCDLNQPLPFPAGSFDRIVSVNVLYALDDPARALDRFGELLTPTGRMVHAVPQRGFSMPTVLAEHVRRLRGLQKLHVTWLVPPLLLVALFNLSIFRQVDEGKYSFLTGEQARDLSRRAGWRGDLSQTYAGQDWLIALERSC